MTDRADTGRRIIDENAYMVIGTADAAGVPWVSPVYFAHHEYTDFYWVSTPEATHSGNLVMRPDVAIVVFDSSVPPGSGQAVYMHARAEQIEDDAVERGIEIFSRRSVTHGIKEWTAADVSGESPFPVVPGDSSGAHDARKRRRTRPPDPRLPHFFFHDLA